MWKAVVEFYDLTDSNHKYRVGDVFPRPGVSVSEKRISELSGKSNRLAKPVIEKIEEAAPKKAEEATEVKPERKTRKKKSD